MNLDLYRRNVPKVYWLNFLWGFLLIQSVIVPFFQSRGLLMSQVFTIQAAFSLTLCLLDVPTGYLSDLIGRKYTLLLASALKAAGGMFLIFANGWLQLVGAYVIIGVANSLFSGSDVALMYESVETLPEGERPPSSMLFGPRISFGLAGATVSALVGGLMAAWFSLDVAIVANAIMACTPFLICLTLVEAPRTQVVRKTHLQNFGRLTRELFAESRFVRAVVFATVLYTAAQVLSVYVFQAFWKTEGLSMAMFGPLTAACSLIGAFSGWFAHRFEKRLGAAGAVALVGMLPVVGFLGSAWLPFILAIPFALFLEMERGLGQAILSRHFNTQISSDLRATANSMVSFGSRLFVAAVGPVLGWALDRWSVTACLAGLGVFYLGVLLVSGLPLVRETRVAMEAC